MSWLAYPPDSCPHPVERVSIHDGICTACGSVARHVTEDDVTEPRRVTPEQRRAVDLLELGTPGCPLVRLSIADWKYVDRVIAGLARMGVPAAREPEPEENA